jgi:hypothetical protein
VTEAALVEHAGGRMVRVSVPDGRAQFEPPISGNRKRLLRELADEGYASQVSGA